MCEVTKCESCNVEQSVNNDEHSNTYGEGVKFERIRRITGYLVGTVDRFNDGTDKNIADQFTSARQAISNIDGLINGILTDDYFFRGVRYYSPIKIHTNLNPTLNGTMISDWNGYSSDNKRIFGKLNIIVCNASSSGYWYDLQVRYIPIDGSKTITISWIKYSPPNNDGSNIIFMPLFKCRIEVWIYKNSNKNTGSFDIYRECVLYTGVKEHYYK